MWINNYLMLNKSKRCSNNPWREIRWNNPSQHSISMGWFGLYRICILIMSSEWHMLVVFGAVTLSCVSDVFFRARCHMQIHLSGKLHPRSNATSEPYKPAFHGGHFSRNTSHGGAATLWIFRLPQWRYSYSTQSSITELLLSVSQHWNPKHLLYYHFVYKTSSYIVIR